MSINVNLCSYTEGSSQALSIEPKRHELSRTNSRTKMGLLPVEVAFLVLLTGSQGMSATCVEREEHILRYLISSQPPYDNYYNISKAVYPSVDLPSLLIKITVTFLNGSGNLTHLAGSSRSPINGSTSNISQTGKNVHENITTYKFTWSASCLYVGGGNISLTSMNVFSLWAIYPNRRERQLYLTLPQFCRGFSADTMIYFLSTVGLLANVLLLLTYHYHHHHMIIIIITDIIIIIIISIITCH